MLFGLIKGNEMKSPERNQGDRMGNKHRQMKIVSEVKLSLSLNILKTYTFHTSSALGHPYTNLYTRE